ncbi:immunoglobulin-like domain-containing protein [Photobacterium damselae]|uniref:immunoglobulin-like domain-containing protein n=1 Tax=Photobacterium damselae TaxID=38293 RepID=UPI00254302C2|nr:immunoglobulin-like domain-containing protein [Photobacterium damselae]WIH21730.1 DUF5011 domain-containing protein [Photobacterium damselae]
MTKMSAFKLNALALALSGFSFAANASDAMVNPQGNVVVGYWHNWCDGAGYQGGNAPCITLEETNPMYNIVDVSFMKVYSLADGRIPTFKLDPTIGLSEAAFIDQIKTLNEQGRSVLIALGGADAHVELRMGDEQAFADEIIRLTDTYGFDGLDIDLEQTAIDAADNQTVIPAALRLVKDHYRAQGKNFLITMAPEFPYLKQNGKYIPYITGLEGYYDWINPQFYNQGGDGLWVDEENAWITQNNDAMKEKFIYYISDSLANGTRGFHKIPHDKLVFGIPTNNDAAASGFVKNPQDLFNAFDRLKAQAQPLRGVMTWSINWDIGTNSAGQNYNSSFINAYGPYIHNQTPPPPVEGKPVFSGLIDARVQHKASFDPLSGVSATDKEDGNLTSSIVVEGSVNTQVVGDYVLTYSVTDSDNHETKSPRKVTVFSLMPTITGIDNATIKLGDTFDPLAGVSATDAEDGDLTDSIQVEGQVDTAKVGQYTLTYSITDSADQTVTAKRIITVNDSSIVCTPAWDASKTYIEGDVVSHNGKNWRAGWWTQGEEPGTTGQWGVWREVGNSDCDGEQPDPTLSASITGLSTHYTLVDGSASLRMTINSNISSSVTINVKDLLGNTVSGGHFNGTVLGDKTITLALSHAKTGAHQVLLTAQTEQKTVEKNYTINLVEKDKPTPPPTDVPNYEAGFAYQEGDKVLGSDGNVYQCKPWPYSGWCASASYAPATSQYWPDAWDKL